MSIVHTRADGSQVEIYQLPMGWCWIDLPLKLQPHGFFATAADAALDSDRALS